MNRETEKYIKSLDYKKMRVFEMSGLGSRWETFGFASYFTIDWPEYDICEKPFKDEGFDMVIAEQVLEHVKAPREAIKNIYKMLKPGGVAVITTPFLGKIHNCPIDCSRWTETGLKYLITEGGFNFEEIKTGSWGNKACIKANFGKEWVQYIPMLHSLKNEPEFPISIWAFVKK